MVARGSTDGSERVRFCFLLVANVACSARLVCLMGAFVVVPLLLDPDLDFAGGVGVGSHCGSFSFCSDGDTSAIWADDVDFSIGDNELTPVSDSNYNHIYKRSYLYLTYKKKKKKDRHTRKHKVAPSPY